MNCWLQRNHRGRWSLLILTRNGEALIELPPYGITGELVEETWIGEAWVRFLTAWPIAVYDRARNVYLWPFCRRYWQLSGRWLLALVRAA